MLKDHLGQLVKARYLKEFVRFKEQGYYARYSTKREPSPASIGSDRSHLCHPEGYYYGWEERSLDRSTHGKLLW